MVCRPFYIESPQLLDTELIVRFHEVTFAVSVSPTTYKVVHKWHGTDIICTFNDHSVIPRERSSKDIMEYEEPRYTPEYMNSVLA